MLRRATCNELSWPSRHLRLITTSADLGTEGKMRFASEPSTTRIRPKKEQFSTAISRAVCCPKGASAFGNGSACELPAARIIGMILSDLRIQGCGRINERHGKLQRLSLLANQPPTKMQKETTAKSRPKILLWLCYTKCY